MSQIITPTIPQALIDFIHQYDIFLIAGHKEPDGDCIGSSCALSLFLKRLGKTAILLSAGPFKRLEITMYEPLFSAQVPDFVHKQKEKAAVIIVDCSNRARTGDIESEIASFPAIVIDHHASNTEANPASLVYTEAPSTTFIVQSIIECMQGSVTKEEAEMLFLGLCTDTGYFRHLDERSSEVFTHAARLVAAGVSPKQIFAKINGGKSFKSRTLISRVLSRMQRYYDGKLVISYETRADTEEFGLESRDSDTLYQLIQSIAGVQAICIVRQDTETHCSVGFRSFDVIDVSIVAASFGGGGHKQAAGLYIEGTAEMLIPQFVKAFEAQL